MGPSLFLKAGEGRTGEGRLWDSWGVKREATMWRHVDLGIKGEEMQDYQLGGRLCKEGEK